MQLSEAVTKVNDHWGVNGCPLITAFCPKSPSLLPEMRETEDARDVLHHSGQPVLVELPNVGQVPLVLKTPFNKYTWVATDAHGREHKINTRWIVLSF